MARRASRMIGTCGREVVGALLDDVGALGEPVRLVGGHQVDPPLRAPVVVPAGDEVGGAVGGDEGGDHVEEAAQRVGRRLVGGAALVGHAEEGAEVQRGGVQEHEAVRHGPRVAARDDRRPRGGPSRDGAARPHYPERHGRPRPSHRRPPRQGRADQLHRPRQGPRACRRRPCTSGCAGSSSAGSSRATRPSSTTRHSASRSRPSSRSPRSTPPRPTTSPSGSATISADRGVPLGRRRRELHPQGPRRDAGRARGPHRQRARRRQRVHPHDRRAVDAVGVSGTDGVADGLAADLQRYLQQGRDGLLRSLDGLSEHDARRP